MLIEPTNVKATRAAQMIRNDYFNKQLDAAAGSKALAGEAGGDANQAGIPDESEGDE